MTGGGAEPEVTLGAGGTPWRGQGVRDIKECHCLYSYTLASKPQWLYLTELVMQSTGTATEPEPREQCGHGPPAAGTQRLPHRRAAGGSLPAVPPAPPPSPPPSPEAVSSPAWPAHDRVRCRSKRCSFNVSAHLGKRFPKRADPRRISRPFRPPSLPEFESL